MKRLIPPLIAVIAAVIFPIFFGNPATGAADQPKSTTTTTTAPAPGAPCNATNHFFAADVTGHKFGPAAPTTAPEAVAELKHRISCGQDAALAVTLAEYVQCHFSSPEERVAKTATAIGNPDVWSNFHAAAVNQALDNGNPRIETMKGSYKTLYMTLDGGRIVPEVYSTNPDRPTFQVLTIDTPCGVKHFKLDCGFQPVEQTFPPTIPTKPGKPSKSQPPKETVTHPTTSTPGPTPTNAPTTAPPPPPPGPPTTVKCRPAPAPCNPQDGENDTSGPHRQDPDPAPAPTPGASPTHQDTRTCQELHTCTATAGNSTGGNQSGSAGGTTGTNGGASQSGGTAGVTNDGQSAAATDNNTAATTNNNPTPTPLTGF